MLFKRAYNGKSPISSQDIKIPCFSMLLLCLPQIKFYRVKNIQHPFLPSFPCPTCCIYRTQSFSSHSMVVCVNKYKSKKKNFGRPGPLPACLDSWAEHGAGRVFFKRRGSRREQLKNLGSAWAYFRLTLAKPQHEGLDEEAIGSWGGREGGCGALQHSSSRARTADTMLFLWALAFVLLLQEQDPLGK